LSEPVDLEAAGGKYPDPKGDGEAALKRQDDRPDENGYSEGRNQPSQHDSTP
jgi:hypothetical protein